MTLRGDDEIMEIIKRDIPTYGLDVAGHFASIDLIDALCEQDALSTEFGAATIHVPNDLRKAMVECGLLLVRTRGSVYASDELRAIYARWTG
jgi:hypothetical protein